MINAYDKVVNSFGTSEHPLVKTILLDMGYENPEIIPLTLTSSTVNCAVLAKGSPEAWTKVTGSFESCMIGRESGEVGTSESHSIMVCFAQDSNIYKYKEILDQLVVKRNALAQHGADVRAGLVFADLINDEYDKGQIFYDCAIESAEHQAKAAGVIESGFFVFHQSHTLMDEKIKNYQAELPRAGRAESVAHMNYCRDEGVSFYMMVQNVELLAIKYALVKQVTQVKGDDFISLAESFSLLAKQDNTLDATFMHNITKLNELQKKRVEGFKQLLKRNSHDNSKEEES